VQFFSATKHDDAGEAVTEHALEARRCDEAWEREQAAQGLGGSHPAKLPTAASLTQLRRLPIARKAAPRPEIRLTHLAARPTVIRVDPKM
jgi:hypothetical protein